jgi:two-component system, NtrC family, sensor kinase
MRRRSRTGDEPATARHRKTVTLKRPGAPKAVRRRSSSGGGPSEQAALFKRERDEALEQFSAASEVLQVISSSPGDLKPIFQAMLEKATRICEAKFGNLWLRESDNFRIAATFHAPPAYQEYFEREPVVHPDPRSGLGTIARTKKVIHIADLRSSPTFKDKMRNATIKLAKARSLVAVPLLKDGEVVGAIAIYRQEVRPFTDKQVALLTNFAAQAVIAIENTRLLNELRQRTTDLTESLDQQTATSEVLKVISSSTGDVEPVFQTLLEKAVRLCAAKYGNLYLCEGDAFRRAAMHNVPQHFAEMRQRDPLVRPEPRTILGRLASSKQLIHVPNMMTDQSYIERMPLSVSAVELGGFRAMLAVPMMKDGSLIGAINIYRDVIGDFSANQIELVQNFAAQAVIAIENTRLLNELRQRTDDLTESLEQQTATSEVLKVISSSPGDLGPVFDAAIENATRLCGAEVGTLALYDGSVFRGGAVYGHSENYANVLTRLQGTPPGTALAQLKETRQTVQRADVAAEAAYDFIRRANPDFGKVRTALYVPIVREGALIGVFMIYRHEVRPFTDKQVALVENFAAQAVIAIENTRLLNELRESLQQQTATADVLKVISRSTFDLPAVLGSLVESAAKLCGADKAQILRPSKNARNFYAAASYGHTPEYNQYLETLTFAPGREGVVGRILLERKPVQITDVLADPDYRLQETQRLGGFRTHLGVPLLREGNPIGILVVSRVTVQPFHENHIELLATFADQAVIAIENVRLFDSVEARTRELTRSLEDLRTAQDRLVQTEKLASLGQLTAGIAHEIKNPLNFVNNFSSVSVELIDELRGALEGAHLDSKLRGEINEIADMLQGNLDKVVQHGKRADSIVKNMLLHSREGSGERRSVDVNAIVEESLNLAYHGARAEKPGFNVTLQRSFDPTVGEVEVFPQEITRVLLNLISNGFYAATKRQGQESGNGFEPTITAATKSLGDRVEIRIRDNGIGISLEVREKMFNPFFTTKPAGEGTGLGLSISHDIIVKQHSGSIEVDTKPGAFTEFTIILPRTAA